MNILDVRAYVYMKESGELPPEIMDCCEPIVYEAMIASGIQSRDEYPATVEEMMHQGCVNDFLVDCNVEDRELVLRHAEIILRNRR